MKSGFSEFSYGFAVTHDLLIRSSYKRIAPLFPSQRKEAKVGYDVELNYKGYPLFIQFKLSDYLVGPNAKYRSYYNANYFRSDVTPLSVSCQHNLLKKLADSGNSVFYAAPVFYTSDEYKVAFSQNSVANSSIWIPLRKTKRLTDRKPHHFTFAGTRNPAWHTDEWNLEGDIIEGDFSWENAEIEITGSTSRQIDEEYIYDLRRMLMEIAGENTMADDATDLSEALGEINHLLSTYFGLEMLVLPDTESDSEE